MSTPGTIEVLRAFVDAHDVPHEQVGTRQPIMYLKTLGGSHLQHHGLEGDLLANIDDALLEEMHSQGLIDIDYREHSWNLTPTAFGRKTIEAVDRVESDTAVADADRIVAAVTQQSDSANKLAWPVVRPVLLAIEKYWEAGGFSEHGVALRPIFESVPEADQPLFSATVRSLAKGDFLRPTTELSIHGLPAEVEITEKAHSVLDGWPGAAPEDLFENLVAVLRAEADSAQDPQQKKKLERVLESAREVGIATLGEVLAKVATGGV